MTTNKLHTPSLLEINQKSSDDETASLTLATSLSVSPEKITQHSEERGAQAAETPAKAYGDTAMTFAASSLSMSPEKNTQDSEERGARAPKTLAKSYDLNLSQTSISPSKIPDKKQETSKTNITPNVSRLSRFLTPRKKKRSQLLRSLFDDNPGAPSPPKVNGKPVDMTIDTVERRMKNWLPLGASLLPPDAYKKLAFAIGKGLDLEIISNEGRLSAAATAMYLVDEKTEIGGRFATVYRTDGDEMAEAPPEEEGGDSWLGKFIKERLRKFDTENNEKTYLVFKDPDHRNMQSFRRDQIWGNCHWQGPILLHWYLQLWQDPDQDPNSLRMIDLAKYIRNTLSAPLFYEHVIKGEAADSFENAYKIMPEVFENADISRQSKPFATWVEKLKERGPALAEMRHVYKELHEAGKVEYSGMPQGENKVGSHGLILVGVRYEDSIFAVPGSDVTGNTSGRAVDESGIQHRQSANQANGVYFLLQNYWKDKLLLEIRQDYFFSCEGKLGFSNGTKKIPAAVDQTYSMQTHKVRYAVSAPSLEVPYPRKLKDVWRRKKS